MTNPKNKQLKIDKMFKRKEGDTEEYDEIEEEIQQLEQTLKEKQLQLFQLRRQNLKRKLVVPDTKNDEVMKPEKIVLKNGVESMRKKLELYAMLTGMEVRSYVQKDHCCVVYHMQHHSKHALQHGVRISLASGKNVLEKFSLPTGFTYNTILEEYDQIGKIESLVAIRKALVAFYYRQEQFESLKALVSLDAQLFKQMDGSYIEISFQIQSIENFDKDPVDVQLVFEYRMCDIRPKDYKFNKEIELSDRELDKLDKQCSVFKYKPLDVAFRQSFIQGKGPYKLNVLEYFENERKEFYKQKRRRQQRHENCDVTFDPDESDE